MGGRALNRHGLVVGITGATGHIGGLLLERLLQWPEVAEIRSVARRPLRLGPSQPYRALLSHTCADLRHADAKKALRGVDLLYHLGAQVWQGAGPAARAEMAGVNIEGSRNVLSCGPGAVVLASSVAVYGAWPDNPLPLTEDSVPRPNPECPYATDKLVSEKICKTVAPRHAVVRLSAVLGEHADARVSRAVRGFRLAVPAVYGVAQALQWLDERDAVSALVAVGRELLANEAFSGAVLNVATRDWLGSQDVARVARSRVVCAPRGLLLGLSRLGRRAGWAPFGADRAVLICGPLAVSAARAEHVLCWRAARSSAEVLAEALERDWRRAPSGRPLPTP